MKKQLRVFALVTMAATALGAGTGWAWSSLTRPQPPRPSITPAPGDASACGSGSCCTLSIAAESLLLGTREPAAAAPECCEAAPAAIANSAPTP